MKSCSQRVRGESSYHSVVKQDAGPEDMGFSPASKQDFPENKIDFRDSVSPIKINILL